ncbi:MAG: hypothetical protein P1U56_01190 [Saprospiraceae bacterium]|nr:hypothetical protein [Saprospiraceae bacterium]
MTKKKNKFIEREVEVNFDDEWKVIKLDEHRYYKRVSGYGVSGVDFLAIHPIFGVVLIEMKNYTKGKSSIPNKIDHVMSNKQNDTIRLINIIYKYYQRQRYFRVLQWLNLDYLYPEEWKIWIQAKKHIDNNNYFFLGVVDY